MFALNSSYPTLGSFKSKADAIKYAIDFTAGTDSSINRIPNYTAAQEMFDFICKNVQLPEVENCETEKLLTPLLDAIAKLQSPCKCSCE